MKYEEYNTNGHGRGRGPAEIDSDLHEIRSEMSETLHLLEDKFSPRALIDQLFSGARGARHGSSEFVGNLGATIRDNPVPMLLLASGVVSLLAADRKGGARAARRGAVPGAAPIPGEHTMANDMAEIAQAVEDVRSMKSRPLEVAGAVGERARELRERVGERASGFGERASERANELRARAHETGTAASEHVRDAIHHTRERGSRTLQEEPLVIVGLGLAVGAILGASAPVSERERRILGHQGERLVRRGEGAIDRAKQAVQQGVVRATEVATQQPAQVQVAGVQGAAVEETPIVIVESSPREVGDSDVEGPAGTERKA